MVNPRFKKVVTGLLIGGAAFGALTYAKKTNLIPPIGFLQALVPTKAELPDLKPDEGKAPVVAEAPNPSSRVSSKKSDGPRVLGEIWEWNAQNGLILSNGGPETTAGSLQEKHGVHLVLNRQDDTSVMQKDLLDCATELAGGARECSKGANFVIIMGDGAGQFVATANSQLRKLTTKNQRKDYTLRVIGSVGYSRGEDAFMAPSNVKQNPENAKGLLVSGVLRDGDWNIALKWAGDNNIKNNPDEHTYDPDAINWVNAQDYNTAAADYVTGKKCEDRQVVQNGRPTGEMRHVCVNAIVTWTPGDVTAVQQRGGLVKVVSSKEYRSQMPAVIVGPKAFFDDNRETFVNLLAGAFEGADQIKAYDSALRKAAEIAAKVYKDQNADYWYRYHKGVVELDKAGLNKVSLGGSAVNNLQDNLVLFGLTPASNDNFKSTYTVFANIVMQQYAPMFKDTPIPDISQVEDRSFVTAAQAIMSNPGVAADVPRFAANEAQTGTVISKRAYQINFATGKAILTPAGKRQLLNLKDNYAITGLFIKIDGHTDFTGNDSTNLSLSQARAQAVKAFLQAQAPSNFPDERFEVQGYGSSRPVGDNRTPEGRAANRRVEISLLDQASSAP